MFIEQDILLPGSTSDNNHFIRYAVIGSGSSGNAYAFEYGRYLLIIDAGFKAKVIYQRLVQLGFSTYKHSYIFCTHTHHDHTQGVVDLALMLDAVVVGNRQLLEYLALPMNIEWWCIEVDKYYSLDIGAFMPFTTSHDAPGSLSYYLELASVRFMVLTDTGKILPAMYRLAYYSHVLFLEANYDQKMLENGTYPAFLKRRVAGNKGHLSNAQSKNFLKQIAHSKHLQQVFFCHLSDQNNTVDIVEQELVHSCDWSWSTYVCSRGQESMPFRIRLL